MRQLCNLSYVVQMQSLDEKDQPRFLLDLQRPPAGEIARARSSVSPQLEDLMGMGRG